MFRKKVIIVLYETSKGVRGNFYGSCRLFSYGTLFEKLCEELTKKYGPDSLLVTNVIKL